MPKKKKILRPVVWYVLIGCGDPQDDYIKRVKAITQEDARHLAYQDLSGNKYVKSVDRARKRKRAPPRNRTGTSALRKRRSRPLNQKGKK